MPRVCRDVGGSISRHSSKMIKPSKSAPSQLTIWPSLLLFFPRPAPCFFATSELYVVKRTTGSSPSCSLP